MEKKLFRNYTKCTYKRTLYTIPEPLGIKWPQVGWNDVKTNLPYSHTHTHTHTHTHAHTHTHTHTSI